MDWTNTAHLMQALLVMGCVFALVKGYDSGNKL